MAVAAFKSSSRRRDLTSPSGVASSARESREEERKKAPIRRSKSVSAFSRTSLDISTEFINKRDNPLFWSSTSPRDGQIKSMEREGTAKLDETATTTLDPASAKSSNSDGGYDRRGRSVTRDNAFSCKGSMMGRKEAGRSLYGLDTSRSNRSASQVPVSRRHYSTSESEAEQDCSIKKSKDGNNLKLLGSNGKGGLSRSNNGVLDQMKKLQTWSSQHSSPAISDNSAAILSHLHKQTCEDAASLSTTSSVCGSEEKTMKAVCEQMKSESPDMLEASDIYETVRSEVRRAIFEIQNDLESGIKLLTRASSIVFPRIPDKAIRRNNATAVAIKNVADIPPDLVNPGAVELVLEIRREYSKKLEEVIFNFCTVNLVINTQSQERARKLQADLAVEEHRTQELDRILKEVLPYPKTPNVQKSRPSRKASIERRKMSKRLAEDALAYFDECVSLSPFDGSDFSSQDDPPLNLFGSPVPCGNHLPEGFCSPEQSITNHNGVSRSNQSIDIMASAQCQFSPGGSKFQFSFAKKPFETSDPHHGIQEYIKNFDKNVLKLSNVRSSNYYDLDRYDYSPSAENLLTDNVLMKTRVESGSLLLCGGGNFSKYCGIII
ncbi:uncharacterized protein LOC114732164 isoform X2 [Neltuma alba]|uniref:uncharacterized protein LOC114732164 isoform X2 n=1 Tax=Neltuma alba TaxID=207710 RepID=UPI0010A30094|nr:uncharacterized protein LOC114732164 isoform X2 [Prosopis alba]